MIKGGTTVFWKKIMTLLLTGELKLIQFSDVGGP